MSKKNLNPGLLKRETMKSMVGSSIKKEEALTMYCSYI